VFESCVGPVRAIEHFGTDALRRRVIPAVCRGEAIVPVSMSEPEVGTALTGLTTTGTLRDGQAVLRGTKRRRMRNTWRWESRRVRSTSPLGAVGARQFTDGGDLPLVRRGALGAGSAVAGLR
jgi:hypothetical protein